ncbi:MAG: exodeoxyribonuclease VII large subunit [Alphaproteobacteria bacterium]
MIENNIQPKEFTVSEISFEIKRFVENTFNRVRVKGEIFGGKLADSGHYYLSLKDENATLSAVCWKGTMIRLPFKPEDGMEVIVTGKITTFAGKSSYQIIIETMEVAGTGALLKLLEERKQKFMAEGLFDQRHKKKIPFLPEKIGVITSASGAVIRDIIHRVTDRFPSHILLWPTPVQGEGAAEKIAAAVEGFNKLPSSHKPDVLIVARGGGSLEDLWPFNEEIVIRAVFNSEIPIISAVGHETDTMLIDYVSDLRAPTPTGAAEFAVPVRNELLLQVSNLQNRLKNASHRFFMEKKTYLEALSRGIPNLSQILFEANQKLDDRSERLKNAFRNFLNQKQNLIIQTRLSPYYISNIFEKKKENLNNLMIRLDNVSIDSVLNRGFAWIKNKNKTIYNVEEAKKSQFLEIKFIDGEIKTKVVSKKDEIQGDLFNF